jgi:hypothetical protein
VAAGGRVSVVYRRHASNVELLANKDLGSRLETKGRQNEKNI